MRGLRLRVAWEGVLALPMLVFGRMHGRSSLLCVLLLLLLVTAAASSAAATRAGLRLQLLPSGCANSFKIVVSHGCVVWCGVPAEVRDDHVL
jgi:hypothetical protein